MLAEARRRLEALIAKVGPWLNKPLVWPLILGATFLALSLTYNYIPLKRWELYGSYDWDGFLGLKASSRRSILDYHQFPLWSPWYCGGIADLGHPESRALAP